MKKLFTILSLTLATSFSYGQSTVAVGATCPDFTETDVYSVEQNLYSYCDAGKYVILDFFAYWCGPCLQPSFHLHNFYTKYGCNEGDVIVLGIEGDAAPTLEQLQQFKIDAGIPSSSFPSVLGSAGGNGVRMQYGVSAFPTIVLVGPDRKMINNDIWPISGVSTYESAFPTGAITEMSCSAASLDQAALQASLNLFPNPATNVLNVEVNQIENITITDASGKLVFNAIYAGLNQVELPVAEFQSGIYIVTVTTALGVVTSRFSKQ